MTGVRYAKFYAFQRKPRITGHHPYIFGQSYLTTIHSFGQPSLNGSLGLLDAELALRQALLVYREKAKHGDAFAPTRCATQRGEPTSGTWL